MGKRTGRVCLAIGYLGASAALGLAFLWVPSVPNDAFESPAVSYTHLTLPTNLCV